MASAAPQKHFVFFCRQSLHGRRALLPTWAGASMSIQSTAAAAAGFNDFLFDFLDSNLCMCVCVKMCVCV